MTISPTPEQQAWIDPPAARGEFASLEEAARRLINAGNVTRAEILSGIGIMPEAGAGPHSAMQHQRCSMRICCSANTRADAV